MQKSYTDVTIVPFAGGEIHAVLYRDVVWVALRHLCNELGVAFAPQFTKFKSAKQRGETWAETSLIYARARDGKSYPMTCIKAEHTHAFLTTIYASKVKACLVPRLIQYQTGITEALAHLRKQEYIT
jgi:hypothetical protein